MSLGLTVLHPFGKYLHTGDVISDPDEVAAALASHPAHVVKRNLHPHEQDALDKALDLKAKAEAARAADAALEQAEAPEAPAHFTLPQPPAFTA